MSGTNANFSFLSLFCLVLFFGSFSFSNFCIFFFGFLKIGDLVFYDFAHSEMSKKRRIFVKFYLDVNGI